MNINTNTSYLNHYAGGPLAPGKAQATLVGPTQDPQRTQTVDPEQLAAFRDYTGGLSIDISEIRGLSPRTTSTGGALGSVWDNPKKNPLHDEIERAKMQLEMNGVKAAEILLKHFDYLDKLPGSKTKKKIIDVNDLSAALKDKSIPKDLRRAIEYLLSNPALIDEMNTCGVDKNDDDKFGRKDFEGYIEKHKKWDFRPTGEPSGRKGFPIPGLPKGLPIPSLPGGFPIPGQPKGSPIPSLPGEWPTPSWPTPPTWPTPPIWPTYPTWPAADKHDNAFAANQTA